MGRHKSTEARARKRSGYFSTKEEIFVAYEELKGEYGDEADNFPLGAVGIFSAGEKIRVGLQQLMAGARKWRVDLITRDDLACLTKEAAEITGLPHVMDAYRQEALNVIDGIENGYALKVAS